MFQIKKEYFGYFYAIPNEDLEGDYKFGLVTIPQKPHLTFQQYIINYEQNTLFIKPKV